MPDDFVEALTATFEMSRTVVGAWGWTYDVSVLNDGVAGWNLSAVSPAETVGIFESRPGWNLCGGPQLIECRHNQGANVGFVNGYVKWVNGGSVSSLTWVPEIVPYTGYR